MKPEKWPLAWKKSCQWVVGFCRVVNVASLLGTRSMATPCRLHSSWLHRQPIGKALQDKKIIPSWPCDKFHSLRKKFCFMLMPRKFSFVERFEKACGKTIWCSSDEIITRQVLEDNPRKRPEMPCVSVVQLAKFEIHRRRHSVTEGSEIYSDKRQYLCTSCCC